MGKRGAMEISFGMIFSIILIVVFLAFAFFGIRKIIDMQGVALSSQFKSDLQDDINKMWNGPQGQQQMKYNLPIKIDGVCIVDDNYENLYFLPRGKFSGTTLENIDIEQTLGSNNQLCFENNDGSVTMTLKKDFGENLVTILR
jgi:hypothetical protein